MRFGPRMYDGDGREAPGTRGYKYFGRARELPGVKELFEQAKPTAKPDTKEQSRLRAEMRKNVDADYYGFNRDDDDKVLLEYEMKKEQEALKNVAANSEGDPPNDWIEIPSGWKIPDLNAVNGFILERKKNRLLQKLG
jgi:pre-mRNA-splicing factor ISY1